MDHRPVDITPFTYLQIPMPEAFPFAAKLRDRLRFTGWHFRQPHIHDTLEIGYCHKGKGVFKVAEKLMPFGEGDISVITHLEPHMVYCHGHAVWSWISFDPVKLLLRDTAHAGLLDTGALAGPGFANIIKGGSHHGLRDVVLLLIAEEESPGKYHEEVVRGFALALMGALTRLDTGGEDRARTTNPRNSYRPGAAPRSVLQRVGPALDHLHGHYREKLPIDGLARIACMSASNFRRAFQSVTGVSPHRYLTGYRINAACAELVAGGKTVEAIALDTGFEDPSAFRRSFRTATGMSPAEYRRRRASSVLSPAGRIRGETA